MRISDWSSDVCSSDLIYRALLQTRRDLGVLILLDTSSSVKDLAPDGRTIQQQQIALGWELASTLDAADRKSVVSGKSVSVSVDIGGRRIIKKKRNKITTQINTSQRHYKI